MQSEADVGGKAICNSSLLSRFFTFFSNMLLCLKRNRVIYIDLVHTVSDCMYHA
jgi:hypothetical protein